MNRIVFSLLILFVASFAHGQRIAINETGAVANASAKLDLASTTQGLLTPRMTETQKLAIASPVDGLMIFQTDGATGPWYYDASIPSWVPFEKPLTGTIDMESGVFSGEGFTFNHINSGKDEIFFNSPYQNVPEVIISSGLAEGLPPEPCELVYTNCTNDNVFGLFIMYWNGTFWETVMNNFNNDAPSGCTNNFNRYTYYNYGDPDIWTDNPSCAGCIDLPGDCFVPNQTFGIYYQLTAGSYMKVWVDWNGDGSFDPGNAELVYETLTPSVNTAITPSIPNPPIVITVPAESIPLNWPINGSVTMRVIAQSDGGGTLLPCSGIITNGETEDYEIPICSNINAVYPEIPTLCNINDVTNFGFRISCSNFLDEPRDVKYYFKVAER